MSTCPAMPRDMAAGSSSQEKPIHQDCTQEASGSLTQENPCGLQLQRGWQLSLFPRCCALPTLAVQATADGGMIKGEGGKHWGDPRLWVLHVGTQLGHVMASGCTANPVVFSDWPAQPQVAGPSPRFCTHTQGWLLGPA